MLHCLLALHTVNLLLFKSCSRQAKTSSLSNAIHCYENAKLLEYYKPYAQSANDKIK